MIYNICCFYHSKHNRHMFFKPLKSEHKYQNVVTFINKAPNGHYCSYIPQIKLECIIFLYQEQFFLIHVRFTDFETDSDPLTLQYPLSEIFATTYEPFHVGKSLVVASACSLHLGKYGLELLYLTFYLSMRSRVMKRVPLSEKIIMGIPNRQMMFFMIKLVTTCPDAFFKAQPRPTW